MRHVAVLDVPALLSIAQTIVNKQAQPLPRFPASTRDLAVVVDEALPAGEVALVLQEVAGQLAESVRLFDSEFPRFRGIAQADALTFVAPGDTVYLDGGSTVLELARLLRERTNLTVVTNSLYAAHELAGRGPRLIVIGRIGARVWSSVITYRGDSVRIISVRPANRLSSSTITSSTSTPLRTGLSSWMAALSRPLAS